MSTREDLLRELDELRERVAQLEAEGARRERSEELLRKEHDFLESLLQTVQVIVLVLDQNARIVRFNPYMEELSGYRLEEVRGREWFETFLPRRDRDRIRGVFGTAVGGTQTRGNVNPIVTKGGQECQIEWYDTRLRDGEGRVAGLLSVGLDVTDRLRLEREQKLLQEHLENALAKVISGYLPICAACKRIRDENGDWVQVEAYVGRRTGADFSHGICPTCADRLYPGPGEGE
jgi:PAS domain S-box-containing protein